MNAARLVQGQALTILPPTTMIGALCRYVTTPQADFQPMKANFGLLPSPKQHIRKKRERHRQLAGRALADLEAFASGSRIVGTARYMMEL